MRSTYLLNFRDQLSELNNCLSHYIFVWDQFYIDNTPMIENQSNDLTTDVYSKNLSSKQFNVKLNFLSSSHDDTYNFILKSLFLSTYTQLEAYMRNFYEFARKADSTIIPLTQYDSVPEKIFSNLDIDTFTLFEQAELWTLDYIRLRRNRIVHTSGDAKGELADLIRQKGSLIRVFWQKKLKNGLFGIDFKLPELETQEKREKKEISHDVTLFKKEEIFDLINIWRILADKIDTAICERIGNTDIIDQLRKEFFSKKNEHNIKMWGSEKAERKFKAYCRREFDINMDVK